MKTRFFLALSLILTLAAGAISGGCAWAAAPDTLAGTEPYIHPSGAFSLEPFGTLEEETDNGALFVDDGALLMVQFGAAQVELTDETAASIVMPVLDGIQEFESYTLDDTDTEELDTGYVTFFEVEPGENDSPFTMGSAFVALDADTLYLVLMLAEDYDDVADAWEETLFSFLPASLMEEEPEPLETEEAIEVEETPAAKATPAPKPQTEAEALNGFDPTVDGFSFENYGDEVEVTNLTPAEMQRMFGDAVCASIIDGECILTPPSQKWMQQTNEYMNGGHCEGMAVLSTMMYYDQSDPADFGAKIVNDLELEGNDPLQREIAYWWTTQSTFPGAAKRVSDLPSSVVDELIANFQQGLKADEWWALGIYQLDGSDGHAVTPIGVEDLGDGKYNILVYDNNVPNETRIIEVDWDADTWQYEGSPNPELESFLYEGFADSETLEIVAISPRLEQQDCEFCAGDAEMLDDEYVEEDEEARSLRGAKQEAPYPAWTDVQQRWALLIDGVTDDYYQIWLTGDTQLLIVDFWGRRFGYAEEGFVKEIPGASVQNMRIFSRPLAAESAAGAKPPVMRIPVGLSFDVLVDATYLEEASASDVAMIGPGYYLDVSDIWTEPGDIETIGVHIDKSRHQLTYMTDYTESPIIEMGLDTADAGYALMVTATELIGAEDSFDIGLDMATNEFILNTSYNTDPSTYAIYVLRIDEDGEWVFGLDEFEMDPDNTAYIPFTEWEGEGAGLWLDLDIENDGEIDDSYELPDVTGEFEFYE
jgi:hypothetical protein